MDRAEHKRKKTQTRTNRHKNKRRQEKAETAEEEEKVNDTSTQSTACGTIRPRERVLASPHRKRLSLKAEETSSGSELEESFTETDDADEDLMQLLYTVNMGPFARLPEELVLRICSHLSALDLVRLSAVCRHFHMLSRDRALWRSLVQRDLVSVLPLTRYHMATDRSVSRDWYRYYILLWFTDHYREERKDTMELLSSCFADSRLQWDHRHYFNMYLVMRAHRSHTFVVIFTLPESYPHNCTLMMTIYLLRHFASEMVCIPADFLRANGSDETKRLTLTTLVRSRVDEFFRKKRSSFMVAPMNRPFLMKAYLKMMKRLPLYSSCAAEDIVFFIDLDVEMSRCNIHAYPPRQVAPGVGGSLSRIQHVCDAVFMFMMLKIRMNPRNRFAFALLTEEACLYQQFTNDMTLLVQRLHEIRPSPRSFDALDMASVFGLMQQLSLSAEAQARGSPARTPHEWSAPSSSSSSSTEPPITHGILYYGRSHVIPTGGGAALTQNVFGKEFPMTDGRYAFDAYYLHTHPQESDSVTITPQEVYDGITSCALTDHDFFLEVSNANSRFHRNHALLLSHPTQRGEQTELRAFEL